jgi:hypothetical protein
MGDLARWRTDYSGELRDARRPAGDQDVTIRIGVGGDAKHPHPKTLRRQAA